eukprot:tig00001224_g7643.t1
MGCRHSKRTAALGVKRGRAPSEAYVDVVVPCAGTANPSTSCVAGKGAGSTGVKPALGVLDLAGAQGPAGDGPGKKTPAAAYVYAAEAATAAAAATGRAGELRERVVRVFLSSTFKDMAPEREALFRSAVPRLRRALAARALFFCPVDLRWGITGAEAAGGEVVRICLEEVQRSTYFVAFLKGRYGWHQAPGAPEDPLLKRTIERAAPGFPFLLQYADRSVTEHEILLGAFVNADGSPNLRRETSLFYFSSEALAGTDAGQEGPHAARCLAALKERIRSSGLPLGPPYPSAEALAARIHDDLLALVARDYPDAGPRPWLEEERAAHAAFAAARRRLYLPAPGPPAPPGARLPSDAAQATLRRWTRPELLLVTGPSGCGKSALLANWSAAWRAAHPSDAPVAHYVGGSAGSARAGGLMRRLVEELQALLASPAPALRFTPPSLTPRSPGWRPPTPRATRRRRCTRSPSGSPLALPRCPPPGPPRPPAPPGPQRQLTGAQVVVVDAVDQLLADAGAQASPPPPPRPPAAPQPAPASPWLPHAAAPRLRLLLSCAPGEARDYALRRAHVERAVGGLDAARRRALIAGHLRAASKALAEPQVARLLAAPQTANALFLVVLLEQLRESAVHDTLDERIGECLAYADPVALFRFVIGRWVRLYGEGLVRPALEAVACARHGLADAELQLLLGVGAGGASPLLWAEFCAAASSVLVDRNGLLGFFHRAAAEAVEAAFGLGEPEARRRVHARLGAFFAAQARPAPAPGLGRASGERCGRGPGSGGRRSARGSWRGPGSATPSSPCAGPARPRGAPQLLSELDVLPRLSRERAAPELAHYWAATFRKGEAAGRIEAALRGSEPGSLAADLACAGRALRALGPPPRPSPRPRPPLALRGPGGRGERAGGGGAGEGGGDARGGGGRGGGAPRDLPEALEQLAAALYDRGEYPRSLAALQRALEMEERLGGAASPAAARCLGDIAKARDPRPLSAPSERGGRAGPAGAGAAREAEAVLGRALAAAEAARGGSDPALQPLLLLLSTAALEQGRFQEAGRCPRTPEGAAVQWPAGPTGRGGVGIWSDGDGAERGGERGLAEGRYPDAEAAYREALALREEAYGVEHPAVSQSARNLGLHLQRQHRLDEAEELFLQALGVDEGALGPAHPRLAQAYAALGLLYQRRGRAEEAEGVMRRALGIVEGALGPAGEAAAGQLAILGNLLVELGRLEEAEPLLLRAAAAREAAQGPRHWRTGGELQHLADLRRAQGRLEEAEELYQRAGAIFEAALAPGHPLRSALALKARPPPRAMAEGAPTLRAGGRRGSCSGRRGGPTAPRPSTAETSRQRGLWEREGAGRGLHDEQLFPLWVELVEVLAEMRRHEEAAEAAAGAAAAFEAPCAAPRAPERRARGGASHAGVSGQAGQGRGKPEAAAAVRVNLAQILQARRPRASSATRPRAEGAGQRGSGAGLLEGALRGLEAAGLGRGSVASEVAKELLGAYKAAGRDDDARRLASRMVLSALLMGPLDNNDEGDGGEGSEGASEGLSRAGHALNH